MNQRKIPKVLYYFIITYPLLDIVYSINNIILNVNLPINQAIRVIIMIYLFFRIRDKKKFMIILLLFILLMAGEVGHIYGGEIYLGENLAYITKLLFLIVVIFGIEDMIKNKALSVDQFIRAAIVSSTIICLSVILSAFGLGFQSWESGRTGVKGLFTVQNTITVTLLVLLPLCLIMFEKTKALRFLVNYSLIIISLFLIGTKSGLGGALAITFIQFMIWFFKTRITYLKMAMFSFMIVGIILGGIFSISFFVNFIEEQKALYNAFGYTNIVSFLLSNRDLQISYLENYIGLFRELNPVYLFGLGYDQANMVINEGKSNFQAIEMDFHGIYYYSGIWVLLIVVSIILTRYLKLVKQVFKTKFDFATTSIFISLSIGLFHAFFGGHVLYEALTILYFGGLLSIVKVMPSNQGQQFNPLSETIAQ